MDGLTDNAEVIEMLSEMVSPASVVNSHDKSVNSACPRLEGKNVGCLDNQQIFILVGPDEINSEVLKKRTKLAEAISDLIVDGNRE